MTTYRLLFRGGGGWSTLLSAVFLAILVFWQARADDNLTNELRLRLRYGLGFGTVLLSLGVLFLSCLSVRRDLDAKVLHMLATYPVPRWRMWLGKWCGLSAFAGTGLASLFAVLGLSAVLLGLQQRRHGGERTVLDREFWRAYRARQPVLPSLDELLRQEVQRRRDAGLLAADPLDWQTRRELREDIRRSEQLLEPNGIRSWEFQLGTTPPKGDSIFLEYSFFAQDRREEITGDWRIEAIDAAGRTMVPVRVYPYSTNRLRLPAGLVPPSGRIRVTFAGYQTPWLIVPRGKGVLVLQDAGSIWLNLVRLGSVLLLHLGAVAATGLTLATVLTFPVAAFVGVVLYVLAVATGFFEDVVQELGAGPPSLLRSLAQWVIGVGLWLTRGLSLPPVLARFSEGMAIGAIELAFPWGAGYGVFLLLVMGCGMVWLTRKELDRIH